jgi:hypothetical protein
MKDISKLVLVVIGITLVITAVSLGIKYVVAPIKKQIERKVLVESHQYIEGMEQRAAILRANIAEVDNQLRSNIGNPSQLMGQKAALKAQLRAITLQ